MSIRWLAAIAAVPLLVSMPGRADAGDGTSIGGERIMLAQGSGFGPPRKQPEARHAPDERIEIAHEIEGLPITADLAAAERFLRARAGMELSREEEGTGIYLTGRDTEGTWSLSFLPDGRMRFAQRKRRDMDLAVLRETYAAQIRAYGMPYHLKTSYGDQLAGRITVFPNASEGQKANARHKEQCTISCCGGEDRMRSCPAAEPRIARCVNDCYYPVPPADTDAFVDWIFQEDTDMAHQRLIGRPPPPTYWACVNAPPVDPVRSQASDHGCQILATFGVYSDSFSYSVLYSNEALDREAEALK